MPTSSILNVDQANQTRAAAGIFPVSAAGVALYVSGGGHIVVDLFGYFTGPSAGSGTDGLFTAYDPTRLLDTRGASPLGSGVPLYPGGGLELALQQGGAVAYNVTSVNGAAGYRDGVPGGNRPTANVDRQLRGRRRRGGQLRHHPGVEPRSRLLQPVADPLGRRSAGLVLRTVGNRDRGLLRPTLRPRHLSPGFSACITDGLSSLNATRAAVGVAPLNSNAAAQDFACSYALQLASTCQCRPLGHRHPRRSGRLPHR